MTKRKQNGAAPAEFYKVQNEAEYEAGYRAFMFQCSTYAEAHALMAEEEAELNRDAVTDAWSKHRNNHIDHKPITDDYLAGWRDAQARILREASGCGFAWKTPREITAGWKSDGVPADYMAPIPLKGEPGYEEYWAKVKARNAALQAQQPQASA